MAAKEKMIVIGIDGVPLPLIQPWLDSGEMPNLKKIQDRSRYGPLRSCTPPLTAPAFASIITGKNPGKHGVYDYFVKKKPDYTFDLTTMADVKTDVLWEILTRHKITSGIINLPLTYPIRPLQGFLISGFLTPHGIGNYCYPEGILDELSLNVGDYILHLDEKYQKDHVEPFMREQYAANQRLVDSVIYLMQHKPWDLLFVHFVSSDRVLHEVWHFNDPTHASHDPDEVRRHGNVFKDYFLALDRELGRLLEKIDDRTALLVFSDHGFHGIEKFINTNTWLKQQGFITFKSTPVTRIKQLANRLGFNYYTIGKYLLKLKLARFLMAKDLSGRHAGQQKFFLSLLDVDWRKTQAFSSGNIGQIYINREQAFSQGCVAERDYEPLCGEISRRLLEMRDPATGARLVARVHRKQDIYSGTELKRAPDLLFETADERYKPLGLADFPSADVVEDVFGCTGNHSDIGFIMLVTPGGSPVVPGEAGTDKSASIMDIAPTVLDYFKVPIPADMDGKSLW